LTKKPRALVKRRRTLTNDRPSAPRKRTATDVQTSATAWATVTASLTANDVVITGLREQLTDAVGVQVTLRGKWLPARKHASDPTNAATYSARPFATG